jgi:hypothetical protein
MVVGLKLLGTITKHIEEMTKLRRLEVELALSAERTRSRRFDLDQALYNKFCEDGFVLKFDDAAAELQTYVLEMIRALSRIGMILQGGALDHSSPSIRERADHFVRCWLVLEHHINEERAKRGIRSWQAPIQYLTVVSLRQLLRDPSVSLRIFSRDKPSVEKIYSYKELADRLGSLERQLVDWGRMQA